MGSKEDWGGQVGWGAAHTGSQGSPERGRGPAAHEPGKTSQRAWWTSWGETFAGPQATTGGHKNQQQQLGPHHTCLGPIPPSLPGAGSTEAHRPCCPELFLYSSACTCWVLHERLQNKQSIKQIRGFTSNLVFTNVIKAHKHENN